MELDHYALGGNMVTLQGTEEPAAIAGLEISNAQAMIFIIMGNEPFRTNNLAGSRGAGLDCGDKQQA